MLNGMNDQNCSKQIYTEREIAELLSEFEGRFDTSDFVFEDIWFWPLIRTQLAWRAFYPRLLTKRKKRNLVFRIRDKCLQLGRRFRHEFLSNCSNIVGKTRSREDVIAFVRATRAKLENGIYIDTICGALGEKITKNRVSVKYCNWEETNFPKPTRYSVANIGKAVFNSVYSNPRNPPIGLPNSFSRVHDFAENCLGIRYSVDDYRSLVHNITSRANFFEKRLRAARPRLIITDCWYDWPLASARLAANRLNIPTLELQHGIQEHCHPCFHMWNCLPPPGKQNPFPNLIWLWGNAADSLFNRNLMPTARIVGGHVHLLSRKRELIRDVSSLQHTTLRIGYTLTHPLQPLVEDLRKAISSCPKDWCWFFRRHPSDRDGKEIVRTLKAELKMHNIDISSGQYVTLPDFWNMIDVHVSHESTAALESLAFGLPAIITRKESIPSFQRWIDQGVMIGCTDPLSLTDSIHSVMKIPSQNCQLASESIFGSNDSLENGVATIIREFNLFS